jgi:hypothetical protein
MLLKLLDLLILEWIRLNLSYLFAFSGNYYYYSRERWEGGLLQSGIKSLGSHSWDPLGQGILLR